MTPSGKKNYKKTYEKISSPFLRHPVLLWILQSFNRAMTYLMPLLYVGLLSYLLWRGDWQVLLMNFVLPALSFIVLSHFRQIWNQNRPYQDWPISPLIAKETKGKSMPSRHVFSASLISMCLFAQFPILGLVCLALSALLAVARVVGGVHYLKDVLAGYTVGVLAGLLLLIV
ncbi:phosphatase PAP2 family protein [Streptococcus sp. DD13]|uniref:phosphatase PAP2 family protein n=1 Tax=Streptococcus sp. DD13 TaxID=1777881 RepID=UPI00082F8CAA|nr:phosphatase PAP2 family protein [Streptococcus sp. DD13]